MDTKQELTYRITASASSLNEGTANTGKNSISFGVTKKDTLPSPAELLIATFAACCLKNVERFSEFMKYEYESAEISVTANRQEKPPMIRALDFELIIHSKKTGINADLLLRNLQKFGTIYNTLNAVCEINGDIQISLEKAIDTE